MRSCSKYSADIILWRPFVAIIKPRACHLIKTELGLKGHCHDPSPELIGACEMVAQKILFRVLSKKKKVWRAPSCADRCMCCHLRRTETLRSGLTVLQMTVSESNPCGAVWVRGGVSE
jgi:hypothetical protein